MNHTYVNPTIAVLRAMIADKAILSGDRNALQTAVVVLARVATERNAAQDALAESAGTITGLVAQRDAARLAASNGHMDKARAREDLIRVATEREAALVVVRHAARMDLAPDVLQKRARSLLGDA